MTPDPSTHKPPLQTTPRALDDLPETQCPPSGTGTHVQTGIAKSGLPKQDPRTASWYPATPPPGPTKCCRERGVRQPGEQGQGSGRKEGGRTQAGGPGSRNLPTQTWNEGWSQEEGRFGSRLLEMVVCPYLRLRLCSGRLSFYVKIRSSDFRQEAQVVRAPPPPPSAGGRVAREDGGPGTSDQGWRTRGSRNRPLGGSRRPRCRGGPWQEASAFPALA